MVFGGKIERIYWAAKGLFIFIAAAWLYFGTQLVKPTAYLDVVVLSYVLLNLVMLWLNGKHVIKGNRLFLSLFGFDTVFLASAIIIDGGSQSQLFIGYYALISLLSVYLSAKEVGIVGIVFSASYILSSLIPFREELLLLVLMRTFFIWLLGWIGYMVASHMKSSEKRVLKTLDILNERTWELESSQSLLENMYETTKALSAILDQNQLLDEVMEIADKLLRVRKCAVLLLEPSGKSLYLYAEINSGKKTVYNPPLVVADTRPFELIGAISDNGKAVLKKRPFELELPLVSHGKLLGILQMESRQNDFTEKDRRSFTIFANSTAIAIDNARMHKKMQDLTIIDELTGLFNYRYFRNKLSDEMRRAERYHQQMGLLMVDIDHFKHLNDTQGHQTGNIILQELASVLKQAVRDVDVVARYGGEEFMVILPQTDIDRAQKIAERIRSQVELAYFSNSQGQRYIKLTVSVGVVEYPNGALSTNQLLEKVDQAMYLAKKAGRNRISLLPPSPKEEINQES
jgi:diguanylate cyclase (GGDEF)-like protein